MNNNPLGDFNVVSSSPAPKKTNKSVFVVLGIIVLLTGIGVSTYLVQRRSFETSKATDSASESLIAQNSQTSQSLTTGSVTYCPQNVDIGISIDRSGSMNTNESDGRKKLEWAKDAARGFVQKVQSSGNTNVKLSLNSFGAQGNDGTGSLASTSNSTLHIALTSNYASVLSAVDSVTHVHSGTCIMCGIRLGNQQVQSSGNRKAVILLSDGKANRNWDGTTSNAKANAISESNNGRSNSIEYHVIGFGTGSNIDEPTLRAIAGSTGTYQYKPNVNDWSTAFLNIYNTVCLTPTVTAAATSSPSPSPTGFSLTSDNPTATPSPSVSPTFNPSASPTPTDEIGIGGIEDEPTNTPTPTRSGGVGGTGDELADSGMSLPTSLTLLVGIILIAGALVLAL